SPLVPIINVNIRYYELSDTVRRSGGSIDLTPHYEDEDDARVFHGETKEVYDRYHPEFYPQFKAHADDYFFIKHRNETRGIGGIFYDRLTPEKTGISWNEIFEFSCAVGRSFVPIYAELVYRSRHKTFTEAQKQWQYLRRSRY